MENENNKTQPEHHHKERSWREKERIQTRYALRQVRLDMGCFLKWMLLAALVGVVVGTISTLFAHALTSVTEFRQGHPWIFFLMPVSGLCIVFIYQKFGKNDGGADQVFATVASREDVPLRAAPMIFISTILTHLVGGSAGREGAVIQLGGSIANYIGRLLPLDKEDRHVMVMCGMSAAFAALFGTPMAAAIFAMEVISVGVMYYTALAPCAVAALIATNLASGAGVEVEKFEVTVIPALTVVNGIKIGLLALGCAFLSILFCMVLRDTARFYRRWLKNPYLRVVVASVIVISITLLLGTDDYMGAGTNLITRAIEEGEAAPFAFVWKLLLTALTMRAGFRGGEIVPSFCVGALFGCAVAPLLGLPASICAACGMVALFCGVTNCPMTSLIIAFELFGFEGVSFYLIAVSISYATSGYYGLYKNQKIVYSKYKAKYVNHQTRT